MARSPVPARLAWATTLLDVSPGDEVLEIGCGPGVAVGVVCDRLTTGRVTAIDRSPTAIARAVARNADHVAAGRAVIRRLTLDELEPTGVPFDVAFAVNVNLFWVGPADRELELLRGRLRAGATLWLVYEAPDHRRTADVARVVADALARHGFATSTTWCDTPTLVAVAGRA